MMLFLSINGEKGNLDLAQTAFSSLEKIIYNKDDLFITLGQFNNHPSLLEICVLTMSFE